MRGGIPALALRKHRGNAPPREDMAKANPRQGRPRRRPLRTAAARGRGHQPICVVRDQWGSGRAPGRATVRHTPAAGNPMSISAQKYLVAYSGVLTLVFAAVVLTGATDTRSEKFDTIEVQRINV